MTIEPSQSIYKQIGRFEAAYIDGNPKIHKSMENTNLIPIISQVTTQTPNLPKYLERIISPYMPRKHVLASTYEFLDIIRAAEPSSEIMVSLDVESLFINFPVEEIMKIFLDNPS